MTTTGSADPSADAGLRPAFAATRTQLGLVAALLALAAVGWWWTAAEMRGMDDGPWDALGTLGWFLGVWVVNKGRDNVPFVPPDNPLLCANRREVAVGPHPFTHWYPLPLNRARILSLPNRGGGPPGAR